MRNACQVTDKPAVAEPLNEEQKEKTTE